MSIELQSEILQLLYDEWIKNYLLGLSLQHLVPCVGDENEVNQALAMLENNGLIQKNKLNWNVITTYGIDVYEENLPPRWPVINSNHLSFCLPKHFSYRIAAY